MEDFFGGIFWKNFFGGSFWKKFLGGIFRRNFFGRNTLFTLLKSVKVFEYEWNLCFCQDFGVIIMPGRK